MAIPGPLLPVTPVRWRRITTWRAGVGGPDLTPPSACSVFYPISSPRRLPAGRARVGISVQGPTPITPLAGLMVRGGQPRRRGRTWITQVPAAPLAVLPKLDLFVRGGQPRRRGAVWMPRLSATAAVVTPPGGGGSVLRPIFVRLPADVRSRARPEFRPVAVPPSFPSPLWSLFTAPRPISRAGDRLARMRPGWLLRWVPLGQYVQGQVAYHVYSNSGTGDPINYSVPIATTSGLTWTSGGLASPGDWRFGVRAFWTGSGLEEQNLDCAVEIILDGAGKDITNRPSPPTGLRAFATAGARITVEWHFPQTVRGSRAPVGFHVYAGTGGVPDYTNPAATVLYRSGFANTFQAVLSGLVDDTAYTIGVRAYNASAEEPNITTVTVTADATGPLPVVSLTGIAIV